MKTIINHFLRMLLLSTMLLSCVGSASLYRSPTYSSDLQLLSLNVDSEYIYFTKRETEYYETEKGLPLYIQTSALSNSCGPTAGAIIVGFYDKFYEELIPDYVTYYPASGKYKSADSTYIPNLMSDLYVRMRTNVDDVGVNETDCINGLRNYVESKNRSLSYFKVNSGNKLNESSYLNSVQNNHPILIFNMPTKIYNFSTNSNYDVFSISEINGNHIYVGYGYYKIKYTLGNGDIRTDTYIKVACGLKGYETAYLRIASTHVSVKTDWLMNAYSMSIT